MAVFVNLDRVRRLRFDVNALSDAEGVLGIGLGAALQQDVSIRLLRALLWAGLRGEDRGLTLERAGALLQQYIEVGGNTEALGLQIMQALKASGLFGKAEGDEGNAPGAEATGASATG